MNQQRKPNGIKHKEKWGEGKREEEKEVEEEKETKGIRSRKKQMFDF